MKMSIRTKLFALCVLLVLLTTISSSVAYYILIKQDKHRESQQRIEIAFDIILDDIAEQRQSYLKKFDEFLQRDSSLALTLMVYSRRSSEQLSLSNTLVRQLSEFGYFSVSDRLMVYGPDKALIVAYFPKPGERTGTAEWAQQEDAPVLADEPALTDDIADTTNSALFSEGTRMGIRLTTPLMDNNKVVGIIVGERVFTQDIVKRYADLSQTDINFFAGSRFGLGTLPAQTELLIGDSDSMTACADRVERSAAIAVARIELDDHDYYQGQCALMDGPTDVGSISVHLSQEIEQQAVWKIVRIVVLIASLVTVVAIILSVVFSQGTLRSIQHIVKVMETASSGDLRPVALATTRDEIGTLVIGLNRMITNLRDVTSNVQGASYKVHSTADTILQEMQHLIRQMEMESASVDTTTNSIEAIKRFIESVTQNTSNLLSASAQILASIQETSASIEEVTTSTHSLTTNLQCISASIDQVNQTGKQISIKTGELDSVAQHTAAEIRHIDQSLKDVSHDADRTRQLAQETLKAATTGQSSVEAAIQGMAGLKEVVANTAHIIQEVNAWSERVSSILGIVDDVTEQTSLLALNASIISAQAGSHGRGFAVVANEIKELATRTKASTKEIGTLIHELRKKTEDGVRHTAKGITRSDQGVKLAYAVKDALTTIQEHATRSSKRAENTAHIIQQTADSSQSISASMNQVTDMVSDIKVNLLAQDQDINMVFEAVENISGMAAQVNRSSIEQKRTATEIGRSMGDVTEQFSAITDQTGALLQDSDQIVNAIYLVKSTAEQILRDANTISEETVQHLIEQSEILEHVVKSFKIS